MKKLLLLLMATALVVSCSKDDDGSSVDMSKLVGQKWYYKTYKYSGQTVDHVNENAACGKDHIQFTDTDPDALTLRDAYFANCVEYTNTIYYTVNGKSITINEGGLEDPVWKVIELTSTKLAIESTDDFDGDGDEETGQTIYTSN